MISELKQALDWVASGPVVVGAKHINAFAEAAGLVVLLKETCQTPGCDKGAMGWNVELEQPDIDPVCGGRGWNPTTLVINTGTVAALKRMGLTEHTQADWDKAEIMVTTVVVAVLSMETPDSERPSSHISRTRRTNRTHP